jgi:hypothetical protein
MQDNNCPKIDKLCYFLSFAKRRGKQTETGGWERYFVKREVKAKTGLPQRFTRLWRDTEGTEMEDYKPAGDFAAARLIPR